MLPLLQKDPGATLVAVAMIEPRWERRDVRDRQALRLGHMYQVRGTRRYSTDDVGG